MTPTWRRTAANHFDTREEGARGTMRNPIDVLKLLTEKASVKEYQFERLYRNLYNPDFSLLAYSLPGLAFPLSTPIRTTRKSMGFCPGKARLSSTAKRWNSLLAIGFALLLKQSASFPQRRTPQSAISASRSERVPWKHIHRTMQ